MQAKIMRTIESSGWRHKMHFLPLMLQLAWHLH